MSRPVVSLSAGGLRESAQQWPDEATMGPATAVSAPGPGLVSTREVAALLGTSHKQARRICRLVWSTGRGTYTKTAPGVWLYDLEAVMAVLAEARDRS